jgi:diaminopimelate epimerase
MGRLPFAKVQGLGNDFLVVDLRPGKPGANVTPPPTDPAVAQALCDRHFGIGADGVLAILPVRDGQPGDARMRVINADGSEAEMCGNGIRCVAKVLYEKDPSLCRPIIRIDTGAGLLACAVNADEDGQVRSVSVAMGRPRLLRQEIPVAGPAGERAIKAAVVAGGRSFTFTGVSMGNPHAVIFIDDPAASLRELAETFGPKIEVDPLFPRRTNVEFARLRTNAPRPGEIDTPEIDCVVWERGVGITLACGTGACATAVAAALEGRWSGEGEIPINLLGGTLTISLERDQGAGATYAGVTMRGPAAQVFEAEVDTGAVLTQRAARIK